MMQTLRAVGADAGAVYILAAETTGERELDFLLARGVSRAEVFEDIDRYRTERWEEVIVPNAQAAEDTACEARATWPGYVVINLAGLDVERWRDNPDLKDSVRDLHMLLKDMVFASFAQVVVAGPEWAYAPGERQRVRRALESGISICEPTGRPLTREDLRGAVRTADETIRARLGGHPRLRNTVDQVLPGVGIEP